MKKLLLYITLLVLVVVATSFALLPVDETLIKQKEKLAKENFEKGNYADAVKDYTWLVSQVKGNYEYRYRLGACMLYTEKDKEKGLAYLEEAKGKNGVPTTVNFFLGYGYHLNYRFGQAIKFYEKFKTSADPKLIEKYKVQRQIDMAKNGTKLLRNVTDIVVHSKKKASEDSYYSYFNVDNIDGNIINAKGLDELKGKMDKKKNQDIIIHLPSRSKNAQTVYFSSYGKDGANGKDIYKIKRFPDGSWAQPQLVGGQINSPYDEDYPYMHPNGEYLYFCSKGHNSMGGYDVFRAKIDPNTETFGKPENLDFAINTPEDDFMYIVDSLDQNAYFASTRNSENGQINVYGVKVERYPVLMVILKGSFNNEINPELLGASIKIKDKVTNEIVGVYNSNSKTGDYLITLPKSGKYTFIIEPEASQIPHQMEVDVPLQREISVLPQEMVLFSDNGNEKIKINNRFSEKAENWEEILSEEILKKKAALEENASDFENKVPIESKDSTKPKDPTEVDVQNVSPEDIVNFVEEDTKNLEKELEEAKEKEETALAVASTYYNKSKEAADKAREAIEAANSATNPEEKAQYKAEADRLIEQSKLDAEKAIAAHNYANDLYDIVRDKEEDLKVARDFENGV